MTSFDPSAGTLLGEPPTSPDDSAPSPMSPRRRRRRWLRWALAIFATLVLVAGSIAYWALDRYVIDHVEIGDVQAYEQQLAAEKSDAMTDTIPATTAATTSVAEAADTVATVSTSDPVVTDTTYVSDAMAITISTVVTGPSWPPSSLCSR